MKNKLKQLEETKIKFESEIEKEITRVMFATGMTREQIMKIVDDRLGINQTVH